MGEQRLSFEEVTKIDGYGLIIYFSDSTHAMFTVEELANMRPQREASAKLTSDIGSLNV